MSRKTLFALLALLTTGCGGWHHVVIETRVLVLTPVPVSVSNKIDLIKLETRCASE